LAAKVLGKNATRTNVSDDVLLTEHDFDRLNARKPMLFKEVKSVPGVKSMVCELYGRVSVTSKPNGDIDSITIRPSRLPKGFEDEEVRLHYSFAGNLSKVFYSVNYEGREISLEGSVSSKNRLHIQSHKGVSQKDFFVVRERIQGFVSCQLELRHLEDGILINRDSEGNISELSLRGVSMKVSRDGGYSAPLKLMVTSPDNRVVVYRFQHPGGNDYDRLLYEPNGLLSGSRHYAPFDLQPGNYNLVISGEGFWSKAKSHVKYLSMKADLRPVEKAEKQFMEVLRHEGHPFAECVAFE